jgi:hypothetical protein
MLENLENNSPADKYRLELEYRNPLHAFVLRAMLKEKTRDHQAQEDWATEYGGRISDVIDTPAHEDIRVLAREGKYKEAAEMVMKILEAEDALRGS